MQDWSHCCETHSEPFQVKSNFQSTAQFSHARLHDAMATNYLFGMMAFHFGKFCKNRKLAARQAKPDTRACKTH
jgi:hypothetical protein